MNSGNSPTIARIPAVLATMTALAAAGLPARASLVTNGGFEAPAIAAATFVNVVGGAEPAGFAWTVTTNNVDIFSNGVLSTTAVAHDGVQALDLVGFGDTGAISQSFATTAGQTYRLSFAYGNNPVSTGSASADVRVLDGATSLLAASITHASSTLADFHWDLFDATFVGTGGTVSLSFVNTVGGSNGGILLDAIAVDAVTAPPPGVPVPGTAALALAGLLAIGCGAFGRRRPR